MLQEKKLEAGTLPVLAKHFRLTEKFRDAANHRNDLVPLHESIEPHGQMRISGESPGNTHREPCFGSVKAFAGYGGQADVVGLLLGAPGAAAGGGNLEISR